jgi:putative membrane protein
MKVLSRTFFTVCLLGLAGTTNAQDTLPQTAPMTPHDTSTPAQNPTEALSDQQITAILLAANKAEISAGKHAQKAAKKKEVQDFAKGMVKDHSQASKDVKALATKHKIKEQGSPVKDQLEAAAKDSDRKWKDKKGAEFDKAYMDEQVTMHQTVLNSIDTELLPNAKNEELKTLLTQVRGTVSAHLDHAKQIQSAVRSM